MRSLFVAAKNQVCGLKQHSEVIGSLLNQSTEAEGAATNKLMDLDSSSFFKDEAADKSMTAKENQNPGSLDDLQSVDMQSVTSSSAPSMSFEGSKVFAKKAFIGN